MPDADRPDGDRPLPTLELLGRRWMPTILAELAGGALGFSELRRRCRAMSSSVLSDRLSELRDAGMATPDEFGAWELTPSGARLGSALRELADLDGEQASLSR